MSRGSQNLPALTSNLDGGMANEQNDYTGHAHCKRCGKETPHTFHSEGHERDSSGDYRECQECGKVHWYNLYGYTDDPKPRDSK